MNEEDNEQSKSRMTVLQCEDLNNRHQEAVLINDRPAAHDTPKKPEPKIVDDALNGQPLNAEIPDELARPMSPEVEIGENQKELDTSKTSEMSASILLANAEAQKDTDITKEMKKADEIDQTELDPTIAVVEKIKPLVDYDDTFTDVTQPTVEDSQNEDAHEDVDSDLTQEFVSLSEILTSQLDTSIPSEFKTDSDKEQPIEQTGKKDVKANVQAGKRKKKRLGNTGIVKKVKVKGKEITDEQREVDDKDVTDHDQTNDEVDAKIPLKGDKSAVK